MEAPAPHADPIKVKKLSARLEKFLPTIDLVLVLLTDQLVGLELILMASKETLNYSMA